MQMPYTGGMLTTPLYAYLVITLTRGFASR